MCLTLLMSRKLFASSLNAGVSRHCPCMQFYKDLSPQTVIGFYPATIEQEISGQR